MHHGPGRGPAAPDRHLQGIDDQLGAHVIGDRPAHHLPGEHVEHRRAVDLPGPGGVLGDVGAPQQIRPSGHEPSLHEVLVNRLSRPVATLVAVADPATAGHPQQSSHALAPDPDAHPEPELGVHPWGAVGAP